MDVGAHVFAEAHLLSLGGWPLKGEIKAFDERLEIRASPLQKVNVRGSKLTRGRPSLRVPPLLKVLTLL